MRKETWESKVEKYAGIDCVEGKAVSFIAELLKNGIPLKAINTNDWSSSPQTIVYIMIPYGRRNKGYSSKQFQNRFNQLDLLRAVDFWRKGYNFTKDNRIEVREIGKIKQVDPDTGNEIELLILKEAGGGMFAVETDFLLNTDDLIFSVYSASEIKADHL